MLKNTKNIFISIFTLSLILGGLDNASYAEDIAEGATRALANGNSGDFKFTGTSSGTLNYPNTTGNTTLGNIDTNNSGVGDITLSSINTLTVNSIGKINNIYFGVACILRTDGNIYANSITASTPNGTLRFNGTNSMVSSNIGTAIVKIDTIQLLSGSSKATFNGNLYSNHLILGGNATAVINGVNNNFEDINLSAGNNTLTLNQNVSTIDFTDGTSRTLNFRAGKVLSITNAATINDGTINFDYNNASHINVNKAEKFLTTGGLTYSTTSTISGINSYLLDAPTIAKNGDSLEVTHKLDNAKLITLTTLEQNLANFLINGTANNSDNDGAQTAILSLGAKVNVENALKTLADTLAVDKSNMVQKTTMDMSNAVENIVDNRLQSLNYAQFASLNKTQINSSKKVDNGVKDAGFWGEVFGSKASQVDVTEKGSVDKIKGYDATFGGVSFGLDKIYRGTNVNSVVGGAVSHSQGKAESNALNNQKTDIKSYQLSFYNYNGAKDGLGFFDENLINAGFNQYDSTKTIKVGDSYASKSSAKFSGTEYGAKIGVGYNLKVGDKTIFAPVVAIKYFGLQLADYQEKSVGGVGQKVQNDRFDLFTSEAGFKIMSDISSIVRPQINVSWLHNLDKKGAKSTSILGGGNNQVTIKNTGIDLDVDILNIGTQLNFRSSVDSTVMVKYDLQKSANFISHLCSLKYNLRF